jgi:hypothetical protein
MPQTVQGEGQSTTQQGDRLDPGQQSAPSGNLTSPVLDDELALHPVGIFNAHVRLATACRLVSHCITQFDGRDQQQTRLRRSN